MESNHTFNIITADICEFEIETVIVVSSSIYVLLIRLGVTCSLPATKVMRIIGFNKPVQNSIKLNRIIVVFTIDKIIHKLKW